MQIEAWVSQTLSMQEVDLSTIGIEFALSSRSFPINNQTPRAANNLESAKNVFHLQGLFQQDCIAISASHIATGPEVSRRDFASPLDPIPVPRLRDIT
jgi:hypothetical protein